MKKVFNNTWKIYVVLGLTIGSALFGLIVNPHYFFFAVVFALSTAIFMASRYSIITIYRLKN